MCGWQAERIERTGSKRKEEEGEEDSRDQTPHYTSHRARSKERYRNKRQKLRGKDRWVNLSKQKLDENKPRLGIYK